LSRYVHPRDRMILALSGGIDSVVLLELLRELEPRFELHLSALHVNHQLSPNADAWQAFCERLCEARSISLKSVRVKVMRGCGESLEAAARKARYAVLEKQLAEWIVFAQHLDDQAETFLLQLLRGAGARGLSAMPVLRESGGLRGSAAPRYLRPLLDAERAEIEAYAEEHKLEWIEDESNKSLCFDRNYLRHRVLPELAKRFPGYRETLTRASRNLGEAARLLDELAEIDAQHAIVPAGLRLEALRRLNSERAGNLLRYFLRVSGMPMASRKRLAEALKQLMSARPDARICVDLGPCEVRVHRGIARLLEKSRTQREWMVCWNGEEAITIPDLGRVSFQHTHGTGISQGRLAQDKVIIRGRRGGERIRPECDRPRRTLKNLLQEANIPLWERARIPLLFCGEALVWAPGIGIDCEFKAQAGEPGLEVAWQPFGTTSEEALS
jgi:tRNA(Ile)-lysidine synthase